MNIKLLKKYRAKARYYFRIFEAGNMWMIVGIDGATYSAHSSYEEAVLHMPRWYNEYMNFLIREEKKSWKRYVLRLWK